MHQKQRYGENDIYTEYNRPYRTRYLRKTAKATISNVG